MESGIGDQKQHGSAPGKGSVKPDCSRCVHRAFSVLLAVIGVVVGLVLVRYSIHLLLLAFAGILLALFLHGTSRWVSQHAHLPPGLSLGIVFLLLFSAFGLMVWVMTPHLMDEFSQLSQQLPRKWQEVSGTIEKQAWGRQLIEILPEPQKSVESIGSILKRGMMSLSAAAGAMTGFILFLFLGLFLAVNPELYIEGIIRLAPPAERDRTREVLHAIGDTLHWWLIGGLLDMVLLTVLTWLGLLLLKVPLALTLGIFAGLLTFVPFIGPVISAFPAVVIALMTSKLQALYVVLLYLAIQLIESYVAIPIIQQKMVSVPPAVTLLAVAVLSFLLGPLGALLATPIAAVALVLVRMIYVEDMLGEHTGE